MNQQKLRCAVYTRKSSEEGLEQEFNSLDAQREACSAFITSQAGLGWRPTGSRYDDGGLSGGTMDRPALQKLLQDIRDKRIDVVVVYKIDRSLMDFAKIVEVFDAHNVSFVSVTQAFNTTTSMGRLTLNVLLSFAQFEREVTAERIRDKIAASKRKGIWMGGRVPLGYRAQDRKLLIDTQGAEQVRHIFERYLELKSVPALAAELTAAGAQKTRAGKLYNILCNPLYIGKLRHKGAIHQGEHCGIIDQKTFAAVQNLLAAQASRRKGGHVHPDVHLLTGIFFDETGDRLSPVHAKNHGRRYRYYVSSRIKSSKRRDGEGWRLPADQIEKAVADQVAAILNDRPQLAKWIAEFSSAKKIEAGLSESASASVAIQRDLRAHAQLLLSILRKVVIQADQMSLYVDPITLVNYLTGRVGESAKAGDAALASQPMEVSEKSPSVIRIDAPLALQRRGLETRIIIEGPQKEVPKPDQALIRILTLAHNFLEALTDGRCKNTVEVASMFGIHRAEVSRLLPLAFLGPQIVGAILNGQQPFGLSARALGRDIELPLTWTGQDLLWALIAERGR